MENKCRMWHRLVKVAPLLNDPILHGGLENANVWRLAFLLNYSKNAWGFFLR
jgi:hypothetical protein